MHARRHPLMRWCLGVALTAASAGAWALGLGEIRVLSQPGQPPVISSDPSELEQLRAGLASPVVFERVGLERPRGLVSELDFAVAVGGDGRPVIRVTSRSPVEQSAVNFLVEVDWGQGRLVREYSALVNAPGMMAAEGQPAIEAPSPAPSDAIVRAPEAPTPAPMPQAPAEAGTSAPPPARAAAAPSVMPGELKVARGQTLSQIAQRLNLGGTLEQTMVALLRANPEAFINGNLNLLRQGAVLRLPPESAATLPPAEEAAALVRQHIADWRQARQPIPQPVASEQAASSVATQANAPQGARLEIAAATKRDTAQAGTNSGTQAGGEGDMAANEELRQTREDLASRETELQELRERVADLEKLQKDQSSLIALKNTELAQSQKQLADRQGDAGGLGWMLGGLALLVVGLVVGYFLRRKPASVARDDTAVTTPSFARTAPVEPVVPAAEPKTPLVATSEEPAFTPAPTPVPGFVPNARNYPDFRAELRADRPPAPAPMYAPVMVTEHSPLDEQTPHVAPPQWTAAPSGRPTWHSGSGTTLNPPLNPSVASPAERERLDLAIACLDLGDVDTARALLIEIAQGEDVETREEAAQLLRGLG
jgi:pilus assembly protein FimV